MSCSLGQKLYCIGNEVFKFCGEDCFEERATDKVILSLNRRQETASSFTATRFLPIGEASDGVLNAFANC